VFGRSHARKCNHDGADAAIKSGLIIINQRAPARIRANFSIAQRNSETVERGQTCRSQPEGGGEGRRYENDNKSENATSRDAMQ